MTDLSDRRWSEVTDARPELLILPLGATEQHGPHLPLSTDTTIAAAIAARLAAALPDGLAVVAPTLPYGASGEHQSFAGTLSLGTAATELLLVELCRSATVTFPHVMLLAAHGGNAEAIAAAVATLTGEGRDVRVFVPGRSWRGDAHAGRTETSLMLALRPTQVHRESIASGNPQPLAKLMPALRRGGVAAVSPGGVLGDPRGASAAEGRRLLAAATAAGLAFTRSWLGVGARR